MDRGYHRRPTPQENALILFLGSLILILLGASFFLRLNPLESPAYSPVSPTPIPLDGMLWAQGKQGKKIDALSTTVAQQSSAIATLVPLSTEVPSIKAQSNVAISRSGVVERRLNSLLYGGTPSP